VSLQPLPRLRLHLRLSEFRRAKRLRLRTRLHVRFRVPGSARRNLRAHLPLHRLTQNAPRPGRSTSGSGAGHLCE